MFRPELNILEPRRLLAFDPKTILATSVLTPTVHPLHSADAASVLKSVTGGSKSNPFSAARPQVLESSSALASHENVVARAQASHALDGT